MTPNARQAIDAIDAGDLAKLEQLLAAHPELAHERIPMTGEAYFRDPYLLWFVAENPIRNRRLPQNIADVARAILRAAPHTNEQIDYALELVCSGLVPREMGVKRELIDVLVDAGANPAAAIKSAVAHRENDAVERLVEHGASLSMFDDDVQLGLAAAALHGDATRLAQLIARGADINAYAPEGFHAHATPLHHAVDSGSLDAVGVLVEAGADLTTRDRVYQGTPLEWAEYLERTEIAAYLRSR